MSVSIEQAKAMWVLIPHEINADGKVVYRQCKVNKLVQKGFRWSEEIEAMYADFVWESRVGLVTLEDVDHAKGDGA